LQKKYSVCLSIVFNHQFEKNIPILRKIYGERFSTIRYLSPFSKRKQDDDIIPVFETSIHFQGYFSQAYQYLPKDFDYYVFCGDDLILNPRLNETNLIDSLNCHNGGYIKYLNPVSDHSFAWHKFEECLRFPPDDCVIPYPSFLPTRSEIISNFERHGLHIRNLSLHNFLGIHHKGVTWERIRAGLSYLFRNGISRSIPFPLVEGYSDFIVVPRSAWKRFAYLCGVFAAMNLWVDAAVATALALACGKIYTECDHNLHGVELWGNDQAKPEQEYKCDFDAFLTDFPNNRLYLHPIKLSRWLSNSSGTPTS
jgi:hypothetical protein